jgi:hypothetical protein
MSLALAILLIASGCEHRGLSASSDRVLADVWGQPLPITARILRKKVNRGYLAGAATPTAYYELVMGQEDFWNDMTGRKMAPMRLRIHGRPASDEIDEIYWKYGKTMEDVFGRNLGEMSWICVLDPIRRCAMVIDDTSSPTLTIYLVGMPKPSLLD